MATEPRVATKPWTRHSVCDPDDIITTVKDAGLRGAASRLSTGLKWSFVPQGDGKPHYLVVNADESEPGACKDIPIMMANPHALIEGVIITSFAIRANHAFIYIRGEVPNAVRKVEFAVKQAREAGLIGKNIQGSGFDLDVVVHSAPAPTSAVRNCPARQPRGLSRPAPTEAALPGGCRTVRIADGHQQRRDDCEHSLHRGPWRGVVPCLRNRKVTGLQGVRRLRACEAAGDLRGAAGNHHARTARLRRWYA